MNVWLISDQRVFHSQTQAPMQLVVSLRLASCQETLCSLGPQIVGTYLNANYEMGWALMRYQLL